ncbi:MAG: DUF2335 domain-containing protein [Nitrospinae bacterium]|nr:DUF2335 domain-containing protein [Nitrospinota bacterium]MBF0633573.1 DUF2335 domain-containing protein [Nitrospinota bacterium]
MGKKKKKHNALDQSAFGSNGLRLHHSRINIGPIPSPETLAHYDEILPGSAERIISRWEQQGNHRMELEKVVIYTDSRLAYLGMLCAITIGLSGILSGTWIILNGKDATGLGVIISALAALAGVYVYGKRKQGRELQEKRGHLTQK